MNQQQARGILLLGVSFITFFILAINNKSTTAKINSENLVAEATVPLTPKIPEPPKPLPEATLAEAAMVFDLDNESLLFFKDSDKKWPLASLTKLMSATIAYENLDLDQVVYIREIDKGDKLVNGTSLTLKNLLTAMMMTSSNNAAYTLSKLFPSQEFVGFMNQKTESLNMTNTTFFDSTGLNAKNQSTGNDLVKLVQYIWKNHPGIFISSSRSEAQIIDEKNIVLLLENTNKLAGNQNFLGGKTGYLPEAKGNLISIVSISGKHLAIIVLGAENRFLETEKILSFISNNDPISN